MSNVIKTVIQRVTSRNFGNKQFFSFLGQDKVWYSNGTHRPPEVGTYVQFEASQNAKGFMDVRDLVVLSNEAQTVAAPEVAKTVTKYASRKPSGQASDQKEYWANREVRDIETQKRIELQSCRNSALELVKLMVQAESIKMPKAADREEFIRLLVDKYTRLFLEQNENKGPEEVKAEEPVISSLDDGAQLAKDEEIPWE